MGPIELLLTGVGLSMDAFAAAVCQGLSMERLDRRRALSVALAFGGAQALMPLLGWLLGSRFAGYIQRLDHWIAFVLLGAIGANMIRESLGPEEEAVPHTGWRQLALLAVATSIDALAVGVTFAFLEVSIGPASALIGTVTFCLSLAGVAAGNVFGGRWRRQAEFSGGAILIALGCKILAEHLGFL